MVGKASETNSVRVGVESSDSWNPVLLGAAVMSIMKEEGRTRL